MPSLLDIKARIRAVENIQKITRAMQLVAAAKFQRAQNRARSARPYSQELDDVLGTLAAMSAEGSAASESGDSVLELAFGEGEPPIRVAQARLFAQNEIKRVGLVVVTADRGLAGAFNTRLIRRALEFVKAHSETDCRLITIGKKGHQYFRNKSIPIIHHEEGISDRLELGEIKRITRKLVSLFVDGEVDGLFILYARFKTAMQNTVVVEKFLSIPPVEPRGGGLETRRSADVYILEPNEEAVYNTLIPLYATTKVFATLADSFASEYGSRMTAMQLATKNAEEMLESLVILRNRMRQAMITKELAEIVGGAQPRVSA